MDFQLTEEQRILQESARRLAQDKFAEKAFTWEERDEYPYRRKHLRPPVPPAPPQRKRQRERNLR